MSLDTYSFKKVLMIVGAVPVTGYDEGDDVIQVARRVDSFDMAIGADGNGVSQLNADESGEITFRLQQTSLSHIFMTAQFELMKRGNLRSIPFVLKDKTNLVQVVAAAHCVITRPADQTYGTAVGNREWKLIAEKLTMI